MSTAAGNTRNTVALNGQDYILLPLNWRQLKELREQILVVNGLNAKQGMFTEEQQDAILAVVTASINRTRPDVSSDFVQDHLDLGNVGTILRMVFGATATGNGASGEA